MAKAIKTEPMASKPSEVLTENIETVEQVQPEVEMSMTEKINKFIDEAGEGQHCLSDYIRTLYPLPVGNIPPAYFDQHEAKKMRLILEQVKLERKDISFTNDSYTSLGKNYYEGTEQKRKHYHLGNVKIYFEK
jgi:hypothetical protein